MRPLTRKTRWSSSRRSPASGRATAARSDMSPLSESWSSLDSDNDEADSAHTYSSRTSSISLQLRSTVANGRSSDENDFALTSDSEFSSASEGSSSPMDSRESSSPAQHTNEAELVGESEQAPPMPMSTLINRRSPLRLSADQICRRRMLSSVNISPKYYCQKVMGSADAVKRLALKYTMEGHGGCVNCLNFNAAGDLLISGSDDLFVILWDWSTNKAIDKFSTGHRWNVFQAKFTHATNDLEIVTCSRDGQVRLLQINPGGGSCTTRRLATHASSAHKLALTEHCPNLILSCGEDGHVFEIDRRIQKAKKLFSFDYNRLLYSSLVGLYSIHLNPRNPNEFVVCGEALKCRIYDRRFINDNAPLGSFKPDIQMEEGVSCVTAAVYNHTGSEVLASYQNNDIFLFDVSRPTAAQMIRRFHGHRNSVTIKGVNFYGPECQYVVSGSDCGHLFFWDKETGEVVKYMHGDVSGVVNVLEPNPYCSVLATSGLDHEVKLWMATGESEPLDQVELSRIVESNTAHVENMFADDNSHGDNISVYERFSTIWARIQEEEAANSDAGSSTDDRTQEVAINCRPS